jgi:excisionase family DNA binding protein
MENTESSLNAGEQMPKRSSQPEHSVLTPKEVAEFFRVSESTIEEEIRSGKLPAFQIGDERRILRKDLDQFLRFRGAEPKPRLQRFAASSSMNFSPASPFSHIWPNKREEHYKDAFSATANVGGQVRKILIGLSESRKPDKRKKRTVFVDGRPMVQFKAADDFDHSGLMLSIIKTDDRKHLRPTDPIPPEYQGFRVDPYRIYIDEAHTSKNMAVVCSRDDFDAMTNHALIRAAQIQERNEQK